VKLCEKVFLYVRSGEGKSTFLNLISGIKNRYTGKIQVLGQDLGKLSLRQKDTFRANYILTISLVTLFTEQNILLVRDLKV
jgi:putative ABC transport system ATP-binding protein